jgi:hypothetical protein
MAADKKLVLSFLYLTGILFVTILFNPKWATSTTNVYDIHRYVFCSPFFFVFLHHFSISKKYSGKHYLLVVLLSNAFWLLFASYVHIGYVFYFNFCTAIIVLYMLNTNKRYEWVPLAITAINLVVQVNMFQMFLEHTYPG